LIRWQIHNELKLSGHYYQSIEGEWLSILNAERLPSVAELVELCAGEPLQGLTTTGEPRACSVMGLRRPSGHVAVKLPLSRMDGTLKLV
jgi:hypothetical protein